MCCLLVRGLGNHAAHRRYTDTADDEYGREGLRPVQREVAVRPIVPATMSGRIHGRITRTAGCSTTSAARSGRSCSRKQHEHRIQARRPVATAAHRRLPALRGSESLCARREWFV